jgi:pimeloyl-ACP methyl ester carboxylesterase
VREDVRIPAGRTDLHGELCLPPKAPGVVLFAHGSGSSRHSPRNQFVARLIHDAGLGTLLFDLLTEQEEKADELTREYRFDIGLLTARLCDAARWTENQSAAHGLHLGLFGSSTGGAAALAAAAELGASVGAIVSRGGRPDLAGESLSEVTSPTLLIVGGLDDVVINLNQRAYAQLTCQKELKIIPGATHLFEEPGTLEQVARLTAAWFQRHLGGPPS